MSLARLLKAVPPPVAPTCVFNGPWEPVEAEIGVALPQDYKQFCAVYGRGSFMDFLGVRIPRSPSPHTRLETQIESVCEILARDDDLPFPVWPAPGGLIPFGGTDNGDVLLWRPTGEPADWGVAIWDSRGRGFETFDCGLTDFLADLATGTLRPDEFPDDLWPCELLFQPSGPLYGPGALEALIAAVPPPETPLHPFDGPWEEIEARLGTALPADYKEIARRYGQGWFMDFLSIALPGDPARRGSLEGEQGMARDMINYGMPAPYPVWPEPGGLLNIGLTKANDRVFWRTRGAPADWRIVVWRRGTQELEALDCDLAGFLAGVAKAEILLEEFDRWMLYQSPRFAPGGPPLSPRLNDPGAQTARRGIDALTAMVASPAAPYQAFDGPWRRVEAYLGTELPQDYKDFSRLYGSGLFLDLIIIHVPSLVDRDATMEAQARDASRAFERFRVMPYPMWPNVGGLINFGVTENGDYLFWLPEGAPDDWKVVYWDRGLGEDECFEAFDCGMAAFLAGLVDGSILPRGHTPEDLEPIGPIFQPYADRVED